MKTTTIYEKTVIKLVAAIIRDNLVVGSEKVTVETYGGGSFLVTVRGGYFNLHTFETIKNRISHVFQNGKVWGQYEPPVITWKFSNGFLYFQCMI